MTNALKVAAIVMASAFSMTSAQAAEKKSTNLLEGLVNAAVPDPSSAEGVVYSGTLGVTRFVLCTVGKGLGGTPANQKDGCPK